MPRWFNVTGTCVSGGYGWGKTGQVQSMGNIEALDEQDAKDRAKRIFPGGWRIDTIIEQIHVHDGICGCK